MVNIQMLTSCVFELFLLNLQREGTDMTCDRWTNGDDIPSSAEVMRSLAVVLRSFVRMIL